MRTMKTLGGVAVAATLLLSASVALAEGKPMPPRSVERPAEVRMMGASTTPKEVRRGEDDGARATLTSASTTERGGEQTERQHMETVRAAAQQKMMGEREKVAKRVADIKDKEKQDQAQKIATQFDNLNTTWTDRFTQELDHYDAVLAKIQSRADVAATAGKDVSATTAAIQTATTAIATARAAVAAQAIKTYVVPPTSLTTTATSTTAGQEKIMKEFRNAFQTLHTSLFKDLFALRDGAMTDARKAVQGALSTLKAIPGVDEKGSSSK